jgi:CHAT domain-containing protein
VPLTGDQVKAIAAFCSPNPLVLLQHDATRDRVLAEAGNARILHFACHGLLDDGDPLASCLALTPEGKDDDGMLSAYDVIQHLKLQADLVVLAACQTGLGGKRGLSRSEGVVGLARAFEYAGARSVIVSLWEIADTSSTALMKQLYAGLMKRGLSKDVALQQAQVALLTGKTVEGKRLAGWTPEWAAPYHWAPFILTGDWR